MKAKHLKLKRRMLGLITQKQLAAEYGCAETYLSNVLAGRVQSERLIQWVENRVSELEKADLLTA